MARQRATAAYRQLRQLIVSSRLPPGARLIETDLARRFGFSRTPVRAALRVLAREGYVLAVDGGERIRLVVAPLSVEDARELFQIVGAIEGLAARAAATLPLRKRRRLAAELRGFDQALLAAAAQNPSDSEEIFDLFTRFHLRYVETAAGPRLRALHDSIKPQAERYRRLYSMAPEGRIAASVAEHEMIITAIEDGSGDDASSAVAANWQNAAERLAASIATQPNPFSLPPITT
ncbi:MAG: FCD domain-containing protein [Gemmatimonas sp.]|nr:FCD domain-containing protein [Gemmatimonas sp.]